MVEPVERSLLPNTSTIAPIEAPNLQPHNVKYVVLFYRPRRVLEIDIKSLMESL
jgi:hypothetical protein